MKKFQCSICNKKFNLKESLSQHHVSVHEHNKTNSRGKSKKYFLLSILVIAGIIFLFSFYISSQKPGLYDGFAKCLTETGAVVYGNDFCQYTNQQLNWFGKSEKYLNYVKCIDNKELCDNKGIEITPTWEINDMIIEGVQNFKKLSELSGCQI